MLSHLFVLLMVVVMINLGLWQVRRLEERRDSNSEIRVALQAEPQETATLLASATLPPDHTTTVATGTYLDEHSFLIANRTYESEPGYWLVTPLELVDGAVVAVSRGWVPRSWAAGLRNEDLSAPEGLVTVTGRAFRSVGGGSIGTGETAVLTELNRLDLDRVAELTGLDMADLWLQLAQQRPPLPTDASLPVPVPPASLDDGPHLSYAFQWFFFSFGTVVVYALILKRRLRESQP